MPKMALNAACLLSYEITTLFSIIKLTIIWILPTLLLAGNSTISI